MSENGQKAWENHTFDWDDQDYRDADPKYEFLEGFQSRDAEVAEAKLLTDEWAKAAHEWSSEAESLRVQLAEAREQSESHYRNALEWKSRAVEAQATIEKVAALHHELHGESPRYAPHDIHRDDGPIGWEPYVICDYDKTDWPCRTQLILSAPSPTGGNDHE